MLDSREPLTATAAGLGRLMIGCGAMAVMSAPPSGREQRSAELRLWRTSAAPGPRAGRDSADPVARCRRAAPPIVAHQGAEGNPRTNAIDGGRGLPEVSSWSPRRERR